MAQGIGRPDLNKALEEEGNLERLADDADLKQDMLGLILVELQLLNYQIQDLRGRSDNLDQLRSQLLGSQR